MSSSIARRTEIVTRGLLLPLGLDPLEFQKIATKFVSDTHLKKRLNGELQLAERMLRFSTARFRDVDVELKREIDDGLATVANANNVSVIIVAIAIILQSCPNACLGQ